MSTFVSPEEKQLAARGHADRMAAAQWEQLQFQIRTLELSVGAGKSY